MNQMPSNMNHHVLKANKLNNLKENNNLNLNENNKSNISNKIKHNLNNNKILKKDKKKKSNEIDDKEKDLIECFEIFDEDGDGYISASKLKDVMMNQGDKLTKKKLMK